MPSYSNLLKDISSGNITSIDYIPARREVRATYRDGSITKVPVLPNDQQILRIAEESGTILTVKDLRNEEAMSSLIGNTSIIIIFFIAISFLLNRSAKIANKALGFGDGKDPTKDPQSLNTKFHDIAGISEALEEIKEIVTFLKSPEIFEKIGAKVPKGFLLVGPPGTGKTLLAKAIAGEADVPFFSISASEFVELFVGVGASRVRGLFKKAKENSPSIIFIDEIDTIGRQRGGGIGGGNDEREQTLNQLLTEIDGFADNSGIIIIAATNRPDILDSALTRPGRFDRKIEIYLPDRKARLAILSVHARTKPLNEDVSLKEIASCTSGFSGADLSNLLNEAAIITARRNKKRIGNKEMEEALEKLTLGLVKSPLNDSTKKKIIAYHEVGRALLSYLSPYSDQLDKITILPRGSYLGGYTRFIPTDEDLDSGLITKGYLLSRLMRSLGGRAAEILIMGKNEVTQLSIDEISEATEIAKEMVTKYGFSDLGPLAMYSDDQSSFLGKALMRNPKQIAQTTMRAIDEQVIKLVKYALYKSIDLLKPYLTKMDTLASVLMEEEVISSERFLEIADISIGQRNE